MKKAILSFIFYLILATINVSAKEIAFLNLESVAKGSAAFKKANENLGKKKNKLEEIFKKKEKELTDKKNDIEAKSSILSREALQSKAVEFQKEVMAFQDEVKSKEMELQKELDGALSMLNSEVVNIVDDMMKEKDYSSKYYSVATSVVFVYYQKENDITQEVLKRLNKKNLDLLKNSTDSGKKK